MTITNNIARDERASFLKKAENKEARGKKTAPKLHFSRSPTPAAGGPDRQTKKPEFRQKANKFKPNGHLGAEVSVPNLVRKYAFGGNFQTLPNKPAATPKPTPTPENEENSKMKSKV